MAIQHRNALPKGYEFFGYRIEGVLGHGGFGITYKATEIEGGRRVAIKEYLPAGFATRDAEDSSVHPTGPDDREDFDWGLDRFGQEAQTLVSFHHPNIVAVHRFFEANNTAYLVMEYERGDSLAAILARDKTLPESEIREFLNPLLDGLARVHKAGFMHRDIKPENIFIRTDGSPVLLDFGSARQAVGVRSHSLTSIVSTGYAPFEQYLAEGNQGPWTDIYALGATLYRAVVGEKPPEATARMAKDTLVAAAKAGSGKYGPELLGAIDAALALNEGERPQDIETFRAILDGRVPGPAEFAAEDAVEDTAEDTEVTTRSKTSLPPPPPRGGEPTTAPPGGKPPASMRLIAIVIGAFVLVLLAGGGGYYLWQEQRESERLAEQKRQQAARQATEARQRAEQAKRRRLEEVRRRAEQAKRRAEQQRRRAASGGGEGTGSAGGTGSARGSGGTGGARGSGGASAKGGLIVGRTVTSFQVRNRCRFGVKILVRIKDVNANWLTVAWTAVEPSRTSRAFHTLNRHVYYYGVSHDGRTVFNKGNLNNPKKTLTWQGRRYTVGHVNMGAKFIRWTVTLC